MNSTSRVAVVTGGGRGIGRGIVAELASKGLAIVVNFRADEAAARATCRDAESRGAPAALAIQADVADVEQGKRLLDTVLQSFGRIDVLVNNAGVAPTIRRDVLEMTQESWDRVLGINLRGPFFLTQAVANAMIQLQKDGSIVNPHIVFITSLSSQLASINRGEYCVSKAGLSMVAQVFALRLAELGILVTEVRPGLIATDMTRPVKEGYDRRIADGLTPIRRWGTIEDVGKAVAAVVTGAFPFSTGEVIHVDGGLHIGRL
jgi:NAD(P)-dependent dehydrogenase (short-subunit alcohol dehydrogenase family)